MAITCVYGQLAGLAEGRIPYPQNELTQRMPEPKAPQSAVSPCSSTHIHIGKSGCVVLKNTKQ